MPREGRSHDKPRYPLPWISTYLFAAIALIAGSFLVAWFLDGLSFDYDRYDPDHEFLERIARSDTPREGDFSGLTGGDWAAVCLVGREGNVAAALREGGVSEAQAAAIRKALEDDPPVLHETEFVLVYITRAAAVKLLRHPHGFAFVGEGHAKCTTRGQPDLMLPARE